MPESHLRNRRLTGGSNKLIINIDHVTRIRGTERCWQIETLGKSKDGSLWKPTAYFATFAQALHEAAQREIRTVPAIGFNQAITALNHVTEKYARLFDDVGEFPEKAHGGEA